MNETLVKPKKLLPDLKIKCPYCKADGLRWWCTHMNRMCLGPTHITCPYRVTRKKPNPLSQRDLGMKRL